jgi:hypothetical protein
MKLMKHKAAEKNGLYTANEQESFTTSLEENQRYNPLLELYKQIHLVLHYPDDRRSITTVGPGERATLKTV